MPLALQVLLALRAWQAQPGRLELPELRGLTAHRALLAQPVLRAPLA